MGGGKVSPRLAEGPQVCAASCFRGPSVEQRTLVSQRCAHQGYEGWGREEEGPVRRSVPGQRVVGRGAKLSGHHWPLSVSLGSAGGSRDRSLNRRLLSSCSLLGVHPQAGHSGLSAGPQRVLQFRDPPAERPPNLQVAAPRRRKRRRRTRPGRQRSRSCCTVPASASGSTCAWGSASCP